jgi:hypothetical protein
VIEPVPQPIPPIGRTLHRWDADKRLWEPGMDPVAFRTLLLWLPRNRPGRQWVLYERAPQDMFLSWGATLIKPWGTEPWRRVGDMPCDTCGLMFSRHHVEQGPGYGFCGDQVLTLHRMCNGDLVHL